ncbi:Rossmann-like domain-containing protein [Magnetospirillum sulfuroxidans]|uniref:DUF2478 domain-containing protein n=1 Tax=Magnetospirillum sulfuroxidans TaxID=611300 RepID=A0ABS5IGP7_9PROT|nr:DUF364 domain-containing protein [Magnetospirillum sulfuroxidans]MBR9973441.1 DUF2478 domain-containing protein [Magnetospirillum sulfuroxidans]
MFQFQPTQAPFIRPGVVIHEADALVGGLLAKFALTLKKRGFAVAGCVRRDGQVIDLASECPVSSDMAAHAAKAFRAAMRDDSDLVVIDDFAACTAAAREMLATIEPGQGLALPVLSAIPGTQVQHWLDFAGQGGSMVAPKTKALWQWWGPERLYRDLALGVASDEVRQIVVGPRWLMVQGPAGAGLAYLPRSAKDLLGRLPQLRKQSLRQLADLSAAWDPLEMALGIAAINAHYNRFDLAAEMGNGADTFGGQAGRVVVVGAFPGLSEVLRNPQVIETEPRPGEYPTVAMDTLLPGCAATVVASSTLINRSLPRILRLAHGSRIALVGPATPLTPRLYHYGAEVLGGLVVRDAKGLGEAVRAGAMPREFTRFGNYMHIRHERETAPRCKFRA